MSDLGKAYVQIVPSAKGISGSITKVIKGESESAGDNAGATIGSRIKKAIAAAGIGTAIYKAVSAAMSEGGALEQSLGGIETLFKEDADIVKNYAKQAFKEAGVSANTYMEQVTSFSASLINSLGGDTEKAAEYANTAMNDMSDNANKFGTDIESIQNAYQGFAKQNYTMLDNLKLGYGGTKSEMERLIEDANKLKEAQGEAADLTIESYADVVEAIHLIQENMDVTGTTAKEAASTFTGSFGMMKASVQDFLGALATTGSDSELFSLQESMQNMVSSFSTFFFNNFIPMLGRIIANLPVAIGNFLYKNIDSMAQNGADMMNSMADGLEEGIPNLVAKAMPMILELSQKIRENAGQLIQAALHLVVSLGKGLINSLPTLIEYVPQIITNICSILKDNFPYIISAAWDLIKALAQGLIEAVPTLISSVGNICEMIYSTFVGIDWIGLGGQVISFIGDGLKALASVPVKAIEAIIEKIKGIFTGENWGSIGSNIVEGIANGLKNAGSILLNGVKNLAKSALDGFKSILGINSPSKAFEEQAEWIPEGGAVGVKKNTDAFLNAIQTMATDAIDYARYGFSQNQLANAIQSNSSQAYNPQDNQGTLNEIVSLLNEIKDKSSDVYMDGTKVTEKITQNITKNVNRLNKLKGAY